MKPSRHKEFDFVVYKTTNLINNKIYVGRDVYNNPNYFGSGTLLNKAIKKYGKENFKKEILESCSSIEHLNSREIFWIEKLQARDRHVGYNLTTGGDGVAGVTLTPEHRAKLSLTQKGKTQAPLTPEQRERFLLACKARRGLKTGPRPPMSEEARNKIRNSKLGKKCPKVFKASPKLCNYCNREINGASNYSRWHGENCKHKDPNYMPIIRGSFKRSHVGYKSWETRRMNKKALIENIEERFKNICEIEADFSIFPHTEIYKQKRRQENSHLGEVWTPSSIVDKMLLTSNPQLNQFNLDLCAGRGQFTVRMLRMFSNQNPDFDIMNYLSQYHWFNEFNLETCHELIYIFGENINLAIGPAQELQRGYPETNGVWNRGIHRWHETSKKWIKVDKSLTSKEFKSRIVSELF